MTTLERLRIAIALKATKQTQLTSLQSLIVSRDAVRNEYKTLLANCPRVNGKNCKNDRNNSIYTITKQIDGYVYQANGLAEDIKTINLNISELQQQLKVDQDNSELQTQLLGQQGLTAESVMITAEGDADAAIIEAEADAEATETEADTNSQIALDNAELQREAVEEENKQDLALKDKLKKLLPYFLIIVVILIALYIYKTRIK